MFTSSTSDESSAFCMRRVLWFIKAELDIEEPLYPYPVFCRIDSISTTISAGRCFCKISEGRPDFATSLEHTFHKCGSSCFWAATRMCITSSIDAFSAIAAKCFCNRKKERNSQQSNLEFSNCRRKTHTHTHTHKQTKKTNKTKHLPSRAWQCVCLCVRLDALKQRQRGDADRSCKSQAQAADRGGVTRQRIARCQSQEAVEEMPQDRIARCQAQEAVEEMPQDRGLQDLKL